jgi:hypothetical protein
MLPRRNSHIKHGVLAVRLCSLAVAMALFTASSPAQAAASKDPKIVAVSADLRQPANLDLLFDQPFPDQSDVNSSNDWAVFATNKAGKTTTVTRLTIVSVDASGLDPKFKGEKKVVLQVTPPLSSATSSVDVTLATGKSIVHITGSNLFTGGATTQGPFKACTGKGDCDIYVTGSYTAAVGGSPLYSIDSFGGYMHSIVEKKNYGKFGFYGQVQEKSSSNADPDSFLAYLDYQYVLNNGARFGPLQAPIFNYRLAGSEFNKNGKEVNFVTSPMLTFPLRLSPKLNGPVTPGITFPLVNLTLGTEFVDVKGSVLAPTDRWHTRGLIGATFAAGIPVKKPFLYSVQLTSSYQLRLPSAPEIFFDPKFAPINSTTGKRGTTPPMLGTQPRHYVDTKLTYNFVQWFGLTIEHTYGSLPPSFVKTNHTVSIGLTFTLAETSVGRNSILKP